VLKDCVLFIKILRMHNGCREGKVDELGEERTDLQKKVQIYNEAREAIIQLYKRVKQEIEDNAAAKTNIIKEVTEENTQETREDEDYFVVTDQKEEDGSEMNYLVKKVVIINEWKRMKHEKERVSREQKRRRKQQQQQQQQLQVSNQLEVVKSASPLLKNRGSFRNRGPTFLSPSARG